MPNIVTSQMRVYLDWEENDDDNGIGSQVEKAKKPPLTQYLIGSSQAQINENWYKDYSIPAGTGITVDLSSLPFQAFNLNLTKSVVKLKQLAIINGSGTNALEINNSSLANPVSFLPAYYYIGYSGAYYMNTPSGLSLGSATQLYIHNKGSSAATCRVLISGVKT